MAVRTGLPRRLPSPAQYTSFCASTTITPAMRGCIARRVNVCISIGLPPIARYCLGISPPKRELRPAAGTMHQKLGSVFGIGFFFARLRIDDLIENFTRLDQPEFRTRTLLD